MNDQIDDPTFTLPVLPQTSIDRVENAVFAQIAQERVPSVGPRPTARTKSRRRAWLTSLGIAAAFVVGVLITPPLLNITSNTTAGGESASVATDGAGDTAASSPEGVILDSATTDVATDVSTESADREIITNAQATVRVDDVETAVDAISALAEEKGGFVESTDISADPLSTDTSMPEQPRTGYGWISIRVPSADLSAVIDALGDTGTVVQSSISQQDVTSTAIDLRARVDATQASVVRLTELMSQSGSVSELIEAEVALTDRQAQLESYTQQLAALENQVAMSSLQVELTKETSASAPEPDGFADGLLAGWNGLIVSLNALVIAFGFMLPWLAIVGAVFLVIWLIRRRRGHNSKPEVS